VSERIGWRADCGKKAKISGYQGFQLAIRIFSATHKKPGLRFGER
jgi:hypothetical protein